MKKIGIITFYGAHNYGAMLQAFALNKFLINKNYDSFIINYFDKRIYNGYKVIRPFSKNVLTSIKNLCYDFSNYKLKEERYINFLAFSTNNLKLTSLCKSKSDVVSISTQFDCLIAGSDQIWNVGITKKLSDIYTMNFAYLGKKISYAASIGDVRQIEENIKDFTKKISQIDKISVREKDAKIALEKIIDNKIDVVLDPTLLLKKEEWDGELSLISDVDEKYIIAYMIKTDEEYIKIVNELSEKAGLKVLHFEPKNSSYKNVLKSAYTSGPESFVSLIKNAEYVITTSFHATVFSIIFNKKFWVVPHKTTGSRVTDLLAKLGISNRAVNTLEEFNKKDYNEEINYKEVNKILEKEREKSIKWLIDAIERK